MPNSKNSKNVVEESGKKVEPDNRCFVIMPISNQEGYPDGHFQKVYEQIFKPAIEDAGYIPYRVDDNKICDSIIGKIFDAIQNCPMAICDLSSRNPNVLYELGLRQAYDKPVVLLQDEKTTRIFDVSGIATTEYKSDRLFESVIQAREKISESIKATAAGQEKSIVKIVKARTADYSSVSVTEDDRMEIVLSSIANKLDSLQYQMDKVNRRPNFEAAALDSRASFSSRESKVRNDYEILRQTVQMLDDTDEKIDMISSFLSRYEKSLLSVEGNQYVERIRKLYDDIKREQAIKDFT